MAKEIERKFLVKDSVFKELAVGKRRLVQGYLSVRPESTIRVRIESGKGAWLTIKGSNQGAVRDEWEYRIPEEDARQMLRSCMEPGTRIIDKTRWLVPSEGGYMWEVDEFHGELKDLVVAEIELPTATTNLEVPSWVGQDVTGDPRYYNSVLAGIA